jgi:hypothetical protein
VIYVHSLTGWTYSVQPEGEQWDANATTPASNTPRPATIAGLQRTRMQTDWIWPDAAPRLFQKTNAEFNILNWQCQRVHVWKQAIGIPGV